MSESQLSTVGAVATTVTKGTTPTTGGGSFSRDGVAFVKVEAISPDGSIDPGKLAYIDESTHQRQKRSILMEDDILFTIAGTIGRVARVTAELLPANTNQAVAIIRPDRSKVDPRFLMYALRDGRRLAHALGRVVQSVQANLSLAELGALEIRIPPHHTQRAITEVLGALDDKIAANERLNAAVDDLCEALFAELTGPDLRTFSEIAEVNRVTLKPSDGQLRYLDISSVAVGRYLWPGLSDWSDAPGRARRGIRFGDTVWSTVRPNRRSHALVLDDDPQLVGSTGLAVLSPKQFPALMHQATKAATFTSYLEAVAEGSAYPAVRAERFLDAPIPSMRYEQEQTFEAAAYPARLRAHSATVESRHLATLRDTLLPHLMSGRIAVREAEMRVEEVL